MEEDDIKAMNKMISGCVSDLGLKVKDKVCLVLNGVKDVRQHQPTTSAGVLLLMDSSLHDHFSLLSVFLLIVIVI